MKIYGPEKGIVNETKLKEIKDKGGGKGKNVIVKETKVEGGESVILSERVKDIQKAKEIAKNTPDVRTERVAELKEQIEKGKYHINSKDIAEKMLKDVVSESL
ncbi:MAG: flagellar biosynthesis anti-sigma factor FlgM [Nitrospinae bacterium]|nr:flagellar biosynthesis anti-sigma factor FlgM [Nitrospinota bacterium]